jgi:hypothetical protein
MARQVDSTQRFLSCLAPAAVTLAVISALPAYSKFVALPQGQRQDQVSPDGCRPASSSATLLFPPPDLPAGTTVLAVKSSDRNDIHLVQGIEHLARSKRMGKPVLLVSSAPEVLAFTGFQVRVGKPISLAARAQGATRLGVTGKDGKVKWKRFSECSGVADWYGAANPQ